MRQLITIVLLIAVLTQVSLGFAEVTVSRGFKDSIVASGISDGTCLALLPDDSILIGEQSGLVKILPAGALQPKLFGRVPTVFDKELGLLNIKADPSFAENSSIFVYFTVPSGVKPGNRLSRFLVDRPSMTLLPSTEQKIVQVEDAVGYHAGGGIVFDNNGRLYMGIGDGHYSNVVNDLTQYEGKILRFDVSGKNARAADGNPFSKNEEAHKEIFAIGVRNPFSMSIEPASGKIYENDPGSDKFEEINLIEPGKNYGWPDCEGKCDKKGITNPIFNYPTHVEGTCSITGGAVIPPGNFPKDFVSSYLFADFCGGWIRRLSANGQVGPFLSGAYFIVALAFNSSGELFYLARGDGTLHKVSWAGS